jgi:hypothetical protein
VNQFISFFNLSSVDLIHGCRTVRDFQRTGTILDKFLEANDERNEIALRFKCARYIGSKQCPTGQDFSRDWDSDPTEQRSWKNESQEQLGHAMVTLEKKLD